MAWGNKEISETQFSQLMALKNEDYLNYIEHMDASSITRCAKSTQFLKTQNQPIALGSASKNARTILEQVNLKSHFDGIVDGNDVSKAKPDPEVFLIAAQLLNIAPEHCIVFEDSVAGVEAANVAKMVSIGIGDESILGHADYVFKDFTQISNQFINNLINQ